MSHLEKSEVWNKYLNADVVEKMIEKEEDVLLLDSTETEIDEPEKNETEPAKPKPAGKVISLTTSYKPKEPVVKSNKETKPVSAVKPVAKSAPKKSLMPKRSAVKPVAPVKPAQVTSKPVEKPKAIEPITIDEEIEIIEDSNPPSMEEDFFVIGEIEKV